MLMKPFCVLFLLLIPTVGLAQITSGTKASLKKTIPTDTIKETVLYMSIGYGSAYRILKSNPNDFGKELATRRDEKALGVPSFELGIISPLQNKLFLDFSLRYLIVGEQYDFTLADSSHHYETRYDHICVPLRLHFETGTKITFFAATGFQAQFLSRYRKHDEFIVAGKSSETDESAHNKLNRVTLATSTSIGVKFKLTPTTKLLVAFDHVYQFGSTYNKQYPYIHRAFLLQGKIGIQRSL